jgi:hypothetical protein
MGFALAVEMLLMAGMEMALVDHFQTLRRKCRGKPVLDSLADRQGIFLSPYRAGKRMARQP